MLISSISVPKRPSAANISTNTPANISDLSRKRRRKKLALSFLMSRNMREYALIFSASLCLWFAGISAGACLAGMLILKEIRTMRARNKKEARENESLHRWAKATSMISSELEIGTTTLDALSSAAEEIGGEIGEHLHRMKQKIEWGVTDYQQTGGGAQSTVDRALRLSHSHGIALSLLLESVSEEIKALENHRNSTRSALSGAKASTFVLTCLPLVGIAMGESLGAHSSEFLFSTEVGGIFLLLGISLILAGNRWSYHLRKKAVSA